jgi:hypothetical protein
MRAMGQKMKRSFLFALLAALYIVLPAALRSEPNPARNGEGLVTVAFTGDVNGYIEPCG